VSTFIVLSSTGVNASGIPIYNVLLSFSDGFRHPQHELFVSFLSSSTLSAALITEIEADFLFFNLAETGDAMEWKRVIYAKYSQKLLNAISFLAQIRTLLTHC
jgi:hypothetical protein